MKLMNVSRRTLRTAEGDLLPNTPGRTHLWEVSDALGEKLKKMYPRDVVDPTTPSAPMNAPAKKPEAATGVLTPAAPPPAAEEKEGPAKPPTFAQKAKAAQQARLDQLLQKPDLSADESKEMERLEAALSA